MNCSFCRISSMRAVAAGDREIDRCMTCGALWFDLGEIRELTEGHVPVGPAPEPAGEGTRDLPRKMHREAEGLSCPRCGARLRAIDFQVTGVPVFLCIGCRGYLSPRGSAAAI